VGRRSDSSTYMKLPCSWDVGAGPDFGTLVFSGHLNAQALTSRMKASDELVPTGCFSQSDGIGFREGGFLPSDRWRPACEVWIAGPTDFPSTEYPGSFVALLEISPNTVRRLLEFENCREQYRRDAETIIEMIESELPHSVKCGSSEILGFYRNVAGLASVTFDPDLGKRIGLHLDSWEGWSVVGRRHKRSRILINLGESARYLLFMTTPVDVLWEHLGALEESSYLVDQCFAATKRNRKTVFSLEIRPGEAYIAPTECLVHDGSTRDGKSIDICFTLRSQFILKA
jgi:hypothetical protein